MAFRYEVSFWFGKRKQEGEPDRIVDVEINHIFADRNMIIALALKKVGSYPRTYCASVKLPDALCYVSPDKKEYDKNISVTKFSMMHEGYCIICQQPGTGGVRINLGGPLIFDVCPFHAEKLRKELEAL